MKHDLPPGLHFYYRARSKAVIAFFAIFTVGFIVGMLVAPTNFYLWGGAVLALGISINISSLTIAIDDHSIYFVYGVGLFQKVVDIHLITDLAIGPNNTIHMIYNIASPNVLRIRDRDGRRSIIGVGQPRQVLEFLRSKSRGG